MKGSLELEHRKVDSKARQGVSLIRSRMYGGLGNEEKVNLCRVGRQLMPVVRVLPGESFL